MSFWEDDAAGRIVCQRVEEYADGPTSASMLSTNHWQTSDDKAIVRERRRCTVYPLAAGQWLMVIDVQLESLPGRPIVLGKTPYGIIGLQVAKSMGVSDGGGRTLNSAGQVNEPAVRFQPARWVDYSGPVSNTAAAGLTLMDHPANPGHPNPFMARNGGWMGICPTLNQTLTVEPGKPLRLRYGLWIHAGVAKQEEAAGQWEAFCAARTGVDDAQAVSGTTRQAYCRLNPLRRHKRRFPWTQNHHLTYNCCAHLHPGRTRPVFDPYYSWLGIMPENSRPITIACWAFGCSRTIRMRLPMRPTSAWPTCGPSRTVRTATCRRSF